MKNQCLALLLIAISTPSFSGEYSALCREKGKTTMEEVSCLYRVEEILQEKLETANSRLNKKVTELKETGSVAWQDLEKSQAEASFVFEQYLDAHCDLYTTMVVGAGNGQGLASTECRIGEIKKRIMSIEELLREVR